MRKTSSQGLSTHRHPFFPICLITGWNSPPLHMCFQTIRIIKLPLETSLEMAHKIEKSREFLCKKILRHEVKAASSKTESAPSNAKAGPSKTGCLEFKQYCRTLFFLLLLLSFFCIFAKHITKSAWNNHSTKTTCWYLANICHNRFKLLNLFTSTDHFFKRHKFLLLFVTLNQVQNSHTEIKLCNLTSIIIKRKL